MVRCNFSKILGLIIFITCGKAVYYIDTSVSKSIVGGTCIDLESNVICGPPWYLVHRD